GRRLIQAVRRVLDYEAFLSVWRIGDLLLERLLSTACGGHLQAEIAANPVLQMDHVIALLQIGEINIQQRTRSLRVARFQPARTLHFVAPKDFSIRHNHQTSRLRDKPAAERPDRCQNLLTRRIILETVLAANFLESLPLALV